MVFGYYQPSLLERNEKNQKGKDRKKKLKIAKQKREKTSLGNAGKKKASRSAEKDKENSSNSNSESSSAPQEAGKATSGVSKMGAGLATSISSSGTVAENKEVIAQGGKESILHGTSKIIRAENKCIYT